MASTPLRRLKRVEVDGLFGIYRHCIDLELDARVTLLHGPNGVGKTTVLKMIDALLTREFSYFRRVPFERLLLGFHDGAALELTKVDDKEAGAEVGEIRLTGNGDLKSASVALTSSRAEAAAARVDFLERAGDHWIDERDGEWLTDSEVVRRFGSSRPGLLSSAADTSDERDAWLLEFLDAANSHFIEAQRLVRSIYAPRWLRPHPDPVMSRAVECSRELKKKIDDTMADYGRRAQTLDQSFPQRLLQRNRASDNLPVEEIRRRMSNLDRKTEELKKIGLLEGTPIHQFQLVGDIDPQQAGVMTLYVADTAEKLQVLEDLASRSRLLLNSLNGKFRHKQIRVDRDEGLAVDGESEPLPLDSLSSGEQHELILHYDLLFRVQPNTVVLLDEPELSLHIEWQSKFLSDLMKIVELSGFDALVATHSPYIVGDRDDLMVEMAG